MRPTEAWAVVRPDGTMLDRIGATEWHAWLYAGFAIKARALEMRAEGYRAVRVRIEEVRE